MMSDGKTDTADNARGSKERLLDASLSVFSEKGFAGATTREIALRAGVNEVTLFRLFNSKSGLFDAVLIERFPRSQLIRKIHFDRSSNLDTNLKENSIRLLEIFRANRALVKIILLDLPRATAREKNDPFSPFFVGPLSGYLAVIADLGSISKKFDTEAIAEQLYWNLLSYFIKNHISIAKGPDEEGDRRFVSMAIELFLNGLLIKDTESPISRKKR